MKKQILLLVVIFAGLFTSCNKEVVTPNTEKPVAMALDTASIRAQIASLITLTVKEVDALMKEQNSTSVKLLPADKVAEILGNLKNLKSAQTTPDIYVLPLDSREYIVTNQYVVRQSLYLEIDQNWNRIHEYTIYQTYYFVDGVLDMSSFSFDFDFGCPLDKPLYFPKSGMIYGLQYSFVGEDGTTFFFNNYEYSGAIYLPPLAKGNWYVQGKIRVNDFTQNFITKSIDLYSGSNVLPVFAQVSEQGQNVKYFIQLNKSLLKDINTIYLTGNDSDGNYIWKQIPITYSENWPDQMKFGSQFDITGVQICSSSMCYYYSTTELGYVTTGNSVNDPDWKKIYILE